MRSDDLSNRVRALVAPSLEVSGLELYDVELAGNVLRITVDRPGGVDLDAISTATQAVSAVLDQHDDLIPSRYLLEVSSPGIERNLRRPEHFRGAIGSTVAIKTRAGLRDPNAQSGLRDPNAQSDRRIEGLLEAADDEGVVVAGRALSYDDIERARTRFVWPQATRKAGAPR